MLVHFLCSLPVLHSLTTLSTSVSPPCHLWDTPNRPILRDDRSESWNCLLYSRLKLFRSPAVEPWDGNHPCESVKSVMFHIYTMTRDQESCSLLRCFQVFFCQWNIQNTLMANREWVHWCVAIEAHIDSQTHEERTVWGAIMPNVSTPCAHYTCIHFIIWTV